MKNTMQPPPQPAQSPEPTPNNPGLHLWFQPLAFIIFTSVILLGGSRWDIFLLCGVLLTSYLYLFPPQSGRISPLLFLCFSPILLLNYVSIQDFNIRLISFLLIGLICSYAGREGSARFTINLMNKKALFIWITAFFILTTFACTLFLQNIYLSGDEPHYIMISQSLLEDGDLDLTNNIGQQTYRNFHPLELNSHGVVHQTKLRPFHMPGLSILLLPFYLLYKLLSPIIPPHLYFRLVAVILNSFFALSLFYLLKKEFPEKNISRWWLIFLSLHPIAFHSLHLYPELPAATLLIVGYISSSDKRRIWLSGFMLSLIPWFHLKYIPALMVLGLVVLYRLNKDKDYRTLIKFICIPLFSALCLILYSKVLYGTFNPANIFPSADYLAIPLAIKVKTLLSYFLDQRDGLLLYAPIFFFLFLAGKSRLKQRGVLWGMALTYIFFHAFSTLRGAYSPAARPLVFISWIFILFIMDYGYQQRKAAKHPVALKLAGGISYFILFWLFYHPLFIYQPVFSHTTNGASNLLLFFSSSWVPLDRLFPSFLSTGKDLAVQNLVWTAILFLVVIIFYRKKRIKTAKIPPMAICLAVFIVLCVGLCLFPHITLESQNRLHMGKITLYNSSKNIQVETRQGMLKIKGGSSYHLYLDCSSPLPEKMVFQLHSPPMQRFTIRNGKKLIFSFAPGKRLRVSLATKTLNMVRIGSKEVIHLGLECGRIDAKNFIDLQLTGQ